MKIYAAGGGSVNGIDYADLCIEHGVPKLLSVLNESREIEKYDHATPLFCDSGAHSWTKHNINKLGIIHSDGKPPANIHQHADFLLRFIDKHKMKNWIFVELDAYHDLGIDFVNGMSNEIMQMERDGCFKFMRVYHPYLDETQGKKHLSTMREWIDQGLDYIGISGDSYSRNLFGEIFNITRDKIKLHGFAKSGRRTIERFPFYSVDSTSALVIPLMYQYIPVGYGEKITKKDAIANKDIRYLLYWEAEKRLRKSLTVQKKAQDFYTKLWEARGIKWND